MKRLGILALIGSIAFGCARDADPFEVVEFVLPSGGVSVGADSSPVVLVELGAHTCGVCKKFADSVLPRLVDTHVKEGRLQYRFVEAGPPAMDIAPAFVECTALYIGYLGAVRQFYDRLTPMDSVPRSVPDTTPMPIPDTTCVGSEAAKQRREAERKLARSLHVPGTPTFVLGRIDQPQGRVVGWAILGGFDADSMNRLIDLALAKVEAGRPRLRQ